VEQGGGVGHFCNRSLVTDSCARFDFFNGAEVRRATHAQWRIAPPRRRIAWVRQRDERVCGYDEMDCGILVRSTKKISFWDQIWVIVGFKDGQAYVADGDEMDCWNLVA
jgi:hypothetical protein